MLRWIDTSTGSAGSIAGIPGVAGGANVDPDAVVAITQATRIPAKRGTGHSGRPIHRPGSCGRRGPTTSGDRQAHPSANVARPHLICIGSGRIGRGRRLANKVKNGEL